MNKNKKYPSFSNLNRFKPWKIKIIKQYKIALYIINVYKINPSKQF